MLREHLTAASPQEAFGHWQKSAKVHIHRAMRELIRCERNGLKVFKFYGGYITTI
jgi:hypothetical protein